MSNDNDFDNVPFAAIGNGERAPWADLALSCPECGIKCPLEDSDPPGLTFIACPHGHGVWLRGQPDFDKLRPS